MAARTSRLSSIARCVNYYTPEQVLKTLRRCEEAGINAWQSDPNHLDTYRRYVDGGGKMNFMVLGGNRLRIARETGRRRLHRHRPPWRSDRQPVQAGKARSGQRVFEAGSRCGHAGRRFHPHARRGRRYRVEGLGPGLLHDLRLRAAPQRGRLAEAAGARAAAGRRGLSEERSRRGCSRPFSTRSGPAWRSRSWPPAGFRIVTSGLSRRFERRSPAIKPKDGVIVGIYDRYGDQPAEDAALRPPLRLRRRDEISPQQPMAGKLSRRAWLDRTPPPQSPLGSLAAGLDLGRVAHAAGSDVIKIGFVGCGNRGTGACREALSTSGPVRLVAMGDLFADRLEQQPQEPAEIRRAVPADRRAGRAAIRRLRRLPEGHRGRRGFGPAEHAAAFPAPAIRGRGQGGQTRLPGEALLRRRARLSPAGGRQQGSPAEAAVGGRRVAAPPPTQLPGGDSEDSRRGRGSE